LTRFVNQFKKIIRNDTHLLFETQLQNVLKSSKLVPDVNWSRTFLQNGSIFINGQVVCNPFFQIYKNDFVQLVVTHAYYFFYKWLIVWSTLRKFRFKSKINHKLSKKDLPDDKQKSRSTPSWVLRYRCFTEDAAKNLEIDYLTLSFFVLYEFSNLAELDSTFLFQHRFPVINMHNWKYIN
jgi:ribosomal protein S4